MSLELEHVFLHLSRALMLIQEKGKITWTSEDSETEQALEPIDMNLGTYVIRSFGEQLLEDGMPKEEIEKALLYNHAEPEEYPDGNPYSITVGRLMGGGRRFTRKSVHRRKKGSKN